MFVTIVLLCCIRKPFRVLESSGEHLTASVACALLGLLSRALEKPHFLLPGRFRPHPRERWIVGCPGLAVHSGHPQTECGGHPQRPLAEVWSELLYQVRHSLDWVRGMAGKWAERILRQAVFVLSVRIRTFRFTRLLKLGTLNMISSGSRWS